METLNLRVTTHYVVPYINDSPLLPLFFLAILCFFLFILCMVNKYRSNELGMYCIFSCYYDDKIIPLIGKMRIYHISCFKSYSDFNLRKKTLLWGRPHYAHWRGEGRI